MLFLLFLQLIWFLFILSLSVRTGWVERKWESLKLFHHRPVNIFCFALPLSSRVHYHFFSYPCILFMLAIFPPITAFYPCCLNSFFWCWEILSSETFPILVNMFGSNKCQSMVQANSAMHTLILLIYFWLMFIHSSQPVFQVRTFSPLSLTTANSSFNVEEKTHFSPAF